MKRIALGIAALALAQMAIPARADFIQNGSFETGDLTDWTLGTQSCGDCNFVSGSIGGTYIPQQGNYFMMFGNQGSDITLTQTISDTAGQGLLLSYWVASDGYTTNQFEVKWDGSVIAGSVLNNAPLSGYEEFAFWVKTTGSDTLQFLARDDQGFLSLDNVQLQVPEPASIALLGSGLIAAAGAFRRRGRKT